MNDKRVIELQELSKKIFTDTRRMRILLKDLIPSSLGRKVLKKPVSEMGIPELLTLADIFMKVESKKEKHD